MTNFTKIMSSIFITTTILFTGSLSQASSTDEVYRRSVNITDQIYVLREPLSESQADRIIGLFAQIEEALQQKAAENCGESRLVFREIYDWAFSGAGMNKTREAAQAFAEEMSSGACPQKYFAVFKPTFEWAFSGSGLSKARLDAEAVAKKVSDYTQNKLWNFDALGCMKDEYSYAFSGSGLNLTRAKAEEYATRRCLK